MSEETRAERRIRLRKALCDLLAGYGGAAIGSDVVHYVAVDHSAPKEAVAAAMWTLVDEGVLEYTKNAELILVAQNG